MSTFSQLRLVDRAIYASSTFRQLIEDHLSILKSSPEASPIQPSAELTSQYKGDFYGLLREMGQRPQFYWVQMRLNGLRESSDYQGGNDAILIVREATIDQLLDQHRLRT